MEILFVTSRPPLPVVSGGNKRIFELAKQLSEAGHGVCLATFYFRKAELEKMLASPDCKIFKRIHLIRIGPFRLFLNMLTVPFTHLPMQVVLFRCGKARRLFRFGGGAGNFDTAVFHLVRTGDYVHEVSASRKVMEMTDSLALNFQRRAVDRGQGIVGRLRNWLMRVEAARLAKYEIDCLRELDACVLVSSIDKTFVEKSAVVAGLDPSRLFVIPLGITAAPGNREPDPLCGPPVIAFIGKMDYQPNVEAVLFFATQVLPRVAREVADVSFRVIGGSPAREIQALTKDPRITVTGWVDDIRSELSQACMGVAPMISGTGMQTKILESMMLGLPVVTTPLGASSLDLQHGREIVVAENAEDLANVIVRLLLDRDELNGIGCAGRDAVREKYGGAVVMRSYMKIINGEHSDHL
jgi:glycosyltransferase involved in cell wall biosynthesis